LFGSKKKMDTFKPLQDRVLIQRINVEQKN